MNENAQSGKDRRRTDRRRRTLADRAARMPKRRKAAPSRVKLFHYEITPEPIENPDPDNRAFRKFLGEKRNQRIHGLLYENPQAAVIELEAILAEYGPAPMLYNWLAAAYNRLNQNGKAEEYERLNFERFPDYLFARLNYAETLLGRDEVEEAAAVLDNKFDLKLLHPERTVFHISEYVAMASIAIIYYLKTGESQSAHAVLKVMQKVAPDADATERCRSLVNLYDLDYVVQSGLRKLRRRRR